MLCLSRGPDGGRGRRDGSSEAAAGSDAAAGDRDRYTGSSVGDDPREAAAPAEPAPAAVHSSTSTLSHKHQSEPNPPALSHINTSLNQTHQHSLT